MPWFLLICKWKRPFLEFFWSQFWLRNSSMILCTFFGEKHLLQCVHFAHICSHVFQPAFTIVLNPSFSNTHVGWHGPVTSWPLLLLYWEWVVSITQNGVFWEPVRVITNKGSWVIIHMMEQPPACWVVNVAQYFLRKLSITEIYQVFCNFFNDYWVNLFF